AEARQASQDALKLLPAGRSEYRSILEVLHQKCEQYIALDGKLSAILRGDAQPRDAAERMGLARLCWAYKRRYAAAAQFYAEAFAEQTKLADDRESCPRYDAACCAILAATGQGTDAGKLGDKERT